MHNIKHKGLSLPADSIEQVTEGIASSGRLKVICHSTAGVLGAQGTHMERRSSFPY